MAAIHLLGIGAVCRLPEESGNSWREYFGNHANDNKRHLASNRTALPIRCRGQPCSPCCCLCVVGLLDPLIHSCLARLDPHEERRRAVSFNDVYLPIHQTLSPRGSRDPCFTLSDDLELVHGQIEVSNGVLNVHSSKKEMRRGTSQVRRLFSAPACLCQARAGKLSGKRIRQSLKEVCDHHHQPEREDSDSAHDNHEWISTFPE